MSFALGLIILISVITILRRPVSPPPIAGRLTNPPNQKLADISLTRQSSPVTAIETPDQLMETLLGSDDAQATEPARRILRQAVLSLQNVHETVERFYPNASPRSSDVAVLRSYGQVLFVNDYAYACRVCPGLDAAGAEAAYSNALGVIQNSGVLALAREEVNSEEDSRTSPRPPGPMEDHYEFTRPAYSNLVNLVSGFVSFDPLSTDLFNDVLMFAVSMSESETHERDTLRGFSRMARAEAAGVPMPLRGEEGPEPESDLDPPNVHSNVRDQFVRMRQAYKEIFGYRFTHLHGIVDAQFIETLSTCETPPTQWLHIQPRKP